MVSAQLDGEASALEARAAGHHLASCPSCRRHRDEVGALHRVFRVVPADDVPDLSPAILASVLGASSPA